MPSQPVPKLAMKPGQRGWIIDDKRATTGMVQVEIDYASVLAACEAQDINELVYQARTRADMKRFAANQATMSLAQLLMTPARVKGRSKAAHAIGVSLAHKQRRKQLSDEVFTASEETIDTPFIDAPITTNPVIDAPIIDAPIVDAPSRAQDGRTIDAPVTNAPFVDAPVIDAPAQAQDARMIDAPVTIAPVTDAPAQTKDTEMFDTESVDSDSSGEYMTYIVREEGSKEVHIMKTPVKFPKIPPREPLVARLSHKISLKGLKERASTQGLRERISMLGRPSKSIAKSTSAPGAYPLDDEESWIGSKPDSISPVTKPESKSDSTSPTSEAEQDPVSPATPPEAEQVSVSPVTRSESKSDSTNPITKPYNLTEDEKPSRRSSPRRSPVGARIIAGVRHGVNRVRSLASKEGAQRKEPIPRVDLLAKARQKVAEEARVAAETRETQKQREKRWAAEDAQEAAEAREARKRRKTKADLEEEARQARREADPGRQEIQRAMVRMQDRIRKARNRAGHNGEEAQIAQLKEDEAQKEQERVIRERNLAGHNGEEARLAQQKEDEAKLVKQKQEEIRKEQARRDAARKEQEKLVLQKQEEARKAEVARLTQIAEERIAKLEENRIATMQKQVEARKEEAKRDAARKEQERKEHEKQIAEDEKARVYRTEQKRVATMQKQVEARKEQAKKDAARKEQEKQIADEERARTHQMQQKRIATMQKQVEARQEQERLGRSTQMATKDNKKLATKSSQSQIARPPTGPKRPQTIISVNTGSQRGGGPYNPSTSTLAASLKKTLPRQAAKPLPAPAPVSSMKRVLQPVESNPKRRKTSQTFDDDETMSDQPRMTAPPIRQSNSRARKLTAPSPTYPNGENIILPEIDTEEDEDEDEEEKEKDSKFTLPDWATSPELRAQLARQEGLNPEDIFGKPAPLVMEEVFAKNKERWPQFRKRTSSANWSNGDGLTEEEIRKDMMGRATIRRNGGWVMGSPL